MNPTTQDEKFSEHSVPCSDPAPSPSPVGSLTSARTHAYLARFHQREMRRHRLCLIFWISSAVLTLIMFLLCFFLWPRPPTLAVSSSSYAVQELSPNRLLLKLSVSVKVDNSASFAPWSLINNKVQLFSANSNDPITVASSTRDLNVASRTSQVYSFSMEVDSSNLPNPISALSCAQSLIQDGVCRAKVVVKSSPRYLGITVKERSQSIEFAIKR